MASGAITVSDPLMEAVNSPSRPKIPDRKTKPSMNLPSVPQVDRSSVASSITTDTSRNSVGSEFNKAMVSIDDNSFDDSSANVRNNREIFLLRSFKKQTNKAEHAVHSYDAGEE